MNKLISVTFICFTIQPSKLLQTIQFHTSSLIQQDKYYIAMNKLISVTFICFTIQPAKILKPYNFTLVLQILYFPWIQFPALNDKKYNYFLKIYIFLIELLD